MKSAFQLGLLVVSWLEPTEASMSSAASVKRSEQDAAQNFNPSNVTGSNGFPEFTSIGRINNYWVTASDGVRRDGSQIRHHSAPEVALGKVDDKAVAHGFVSITKSLCQWLK